MSEAPKVKRSRRGRPPGSPHPYKGIPRDQWPTARAERGEPPLAVGTKAALPGAIPVADMPPEQMQGIGWQGEPKPTPLAEKIAARRAEVAPPPNLFQAGVAALAVYSLDGGAVDPLPGFRLHWFVDRGPRLKQAQISGWAFVQKDEVLVGEGVNNDVGSHIRANASKSEQGYQYLMKKPLHIEEAHRKEYENRMILPIKEALKRGQISGNPADMQYVKAGIHHVDDPRTYREGQN